MNQAVGRTGLVEQGNRGGRGQEFIWECPVERLWDIRYTCLSFQIGSIGAP